MKKKKLSREAIARTEVGHTDISRGGGIGLTACFLLLIFLVPLAQLALDKGKDFGPFVGEQSEQKGSVIAGVNAANKNIIKNMRQLETRLEDESFLRNVFLPSLQFLFTRFLDQGNEKVLLGGDDYLFYSVGMDYLVGQPFLSSDQLVMRSEGNDIWETPVQPDPVAAIVHFRDQLALRGIELLIVPVPVKGSIEPERFVSGNFIRPVRNRSWSDFITELKARNINLFDSGPALVNYSRHHNGSFLKTDTHWLPGAMESVAEKLADHIGAIFSLLPGKNEYQVRAANVTGTGDIAMMLTLPGSMELFADQQVETRQVLNDHEEYWQSDPDSTILLLGDSFTNMYSFNGLNWGFAAGLAEHLSHKLKLPLDLIARNDSGAYATREILARELLRGRDRLEGKKLVIWEFSERELASGDWKIIELELKDPVESSFFIVEPGQKIKVKGLVSSISVSPRPGSVPYTDNIVTLHLVDLRGTDGEGAELQQALVYGWGMRANKLTELAAVRPGDKINLTLSSWEDMEGEFGGFRRTPLADEMLELELPNWGKLTDED